MWYFEDFIGLELEILSGNDVFVFLPRTFSSRKSRV